MNSKLSEVATKNRRKQNLQATFDNFVVQNCGELSSAMGKVSISDDQRKEIYHEKIKINM